MTVRLAELVSARLSDGRPVQSHRLQSADEVHHSNRGHEEGKAKGQELHGDLLSGCIEATSQRQATFQILGNQKPEANVLQSGNSAPLFMRRGLFYFRKSFGNFAMFAAIRRASSFASSLAAKRQDLIANLCPFPRTLYWQPSVISLGP